MWCRVAIWAIFGAILKTFLFPDARISKSGSLSPAGGKKLWETTKLWVCQKWPEVTFQQNKSKLITWSHFLFPSKGHILFLQIRVTFSRSKWSSHFLIVSASENKVKEKASVPRVIIVAVVLGIILVVIVKVFLHHYHRIQGIFSALSLYFWSNAICWSRWIWMKTTVVGNYMIL